MRLTPNTPHNIRSPRTRRDGFALLVTVVLVAFLVLIVVALASLTRVETQVAANATDLAKARQNALFALNVALGQLQKSAGPDQRVTAAAEVDSTAVVTNRRWTGVWDSDPASATYGQRLNWLVSGNEPDVTVAPADPASSTSVVRLVGEGSADLSTTALSDQNRVDVPLQEVRSNGLPGLADVSGGHLVGRIGWWVGDEGIKARANLTSPLRAPWFEPSGSKITPDLADQLNDIALAQRNAVEWMRADATGSTVFEELLDVSTEDHWGRWMTREQLAAAASDASTGEALQEAVRARFHDLGHWSSAVQTDVRLGGLKRDLTAAFELNDADFQNSIYANAAEAANRTVMAPGIVNTRFVSPIYSEPTGSGGSAKSIRGPTWHLLRSHYRLYKSAAGTGTAPVFVARGTLPSSSGSQSNNDRLPTPALDLYNGAGMIGDPKVDDIVDKGGQRVTPRLTRSALLPYINRITFVISLQTVQVTPPDGAVGDVYEVRLVLTPIIVMHNPYNVSLELRDLDGDDLWGRLLVRGLPFGQIIRANGTREFTARTGSTLEDRVTNLGAAAEAATDKAMSYNNMMRFLIPAMTLAPGELRVFSPDLTNTVQIGLNMELAANKFVESGYYLNQLNGQRFDYFGGPNDMGGGGIRVPPSPSNPTGVSTRKPWPIGPGGSDVIPPNDLSNQDYRVLVNGSTQIEAAITTTKSGDGSVIVRYNFESENGDRTSDSGDRLSLFNELHVTKPELGSGANAVAQRTYASYISQYAGGQSAASYAGEPVPIFAYDLYVKTPESTTANAARPFVTSNPMGLVTEREALGNYPTFGDRRGFPMTGAPMQPRYRWFPGGGSWTTDILDADPDGYAYWGPSIDAATGLSNVSLIQVPVRPLASIADFQHLMVSLYSHEPYFAIGNSQASPFMPGASRFLDARKGSANWYFGDTSYLANEALWDSSFFSTLAPGYIGSAGYYTGTNPTDPNSIESVRDAWLSGERELPNTRVRPYRSPSRLEADIESGLLGSTTAAAHLLMEGGFNVNSRSVDAWVAVLGGARDAAVQRVGGTAVASDDLVSIPHALPSVGGERTTAPADLWSGFAQLTDTQIRDLAEELVKQIDERQDLTGRPFLSLAEFVNRALRADAYGRLGALQAAINATDINNVVTGTVVDATTQVAFPVPENGVGNSASAASGFLKQADILQQIGPFLSARSDTFTIRSYGDTVDPLDSTRVVSRAWCEAVVQRVPDYVGGEPAETKPADLTPAGESDTFGRRFKVVSFRWLNPEDV